MYKTVFKYSFIVCTVLMIGQMDIDRRQVGDYFTSGIKAVAQWMLESLAENPLVAKISNPEGLKDWFPLGEMKKKENLFQPKKASLGFLRHESRDIAEDSNEEDIELEELSENETTEDFEEPSDRSEDSAVMAILP